MQSYVVRISGVGEGGASMEGRGRGVADELKPSRPLIGHTWLAVLDSILRLCPVALVLHIANLTPQHNRKHCSNRRRVATHPRSDYSTLYGSTLRLSDPKYAPSDAPFSHSHNHHHPGTVHEVPTPAPQAPWASPT